jgi:hypothetical protein
MKPEIKYGQWIKCKGNAGSEYHPVGESGNVASTRVYRAFTLPGWGVRFGQGAWAVFGSTDQLMDYLERTNYR